MCTSAYADALHQRVCGSAHGSCTCVVACAHAPKRTCAAKMWKCICAPWHASACAHMLARMCMGMGNMYAHLCTRAAACAQVCIHVAHAHARKSVEYLHAHGDYARGSASTTMLSTSTCVYVEVHIGDARVTLQAYAANVMHSCGPRHSRTCAHAQRDVHVNMRKRMHMHMHMRT